jgi:hypothetical protein
METPCPDMVKNHLSGKRLENELNAVCIALLMEELSMQI